MSPALRDAKDSGNVTNLPIPEDVSLFRDLLPFRVLILGAMLLAGWTASVVGQSQNAPANPALPSMLRSGAPVIGVPNPGALGTAARSYLTQAQGYLSEGRLGEAKEALRTAIRLEPMNLEAWGLYDYVVESTYIGRSREEKLNPVIDRDLRPTFSIDRVESYSEFGTLYLVGEVKNMSGSLKRQIEMTGYLFDENRIELRKESAPLQLKERGLFPNESSLFEIAFPDPPPGVKSFRVRVSSFE